MRSAEHTQYKGNDSDLTVLLKAVDDDGNHDDDDEKNPSLRGDSQDTDTHSYVGTLDSQAIYVPQHPPVGFKNWGNTCYANAALQCLLSTALASALLDPKYFGVFRRYASNVKLLEEGPVRNKLITTNSSGSGAASSKSLRNYVMSSKPSNETSFTENSFQKQQHTTVQSSSDASTVCSLSSKYIRRSEECDWLTQELTSLCQKYKSEPTTTFFGRVEPIDPGSITRNVSRLSNCLRVGRQEDAHEFLRALLGVLVMDGQNRQLSALFDGLLESAVTCTTCGHSSLTRDRYMDLSLEIAPESVKDLSGALHNFTQTELLSEDNLVDCAFCKKRRQVTKGLRLATSPTILVFHLKRFEYNKYGVLNRLAKHVAFPQKLSIAEFMSLANRSIPRLYELVGVLVHQGRSCSRGHYLAYVNNGGNWYRCSDNEVERVSVEVVMRQNAYILMYQVESVKKHSVKGLVRQPAKPCSIDEEDSVSEGDALFSISRILAALETTCGVSECFGVSDNIANTSIKVGNNGRAVKRSTPDNLHHSSPQSKSSNNKPRNAYNVVHTVSDPTIGSQKMAQSPSPTRNGISNKHHGSSSAQKRHSGANGSKGTDDNRAETPIRGTKLKLTRHASSGNLKERGDLAVAAYQRERMKRGVGKRDQQEKSSPFTKRRGHSSSPQHKKHSNDSNRLFHRRISSDSLDKTSEEGTSTRRNLARKIGIPSSSIHKTKSLSSSVETAKR